MRILQELFELYQNDILIETDIDSAKRKMKEVGLEKINQPKKLIGDLNGKQAHVMANIGNGKYKYIKFGDANADQKPNPKNAKERKKRASFKARHKENINRGPISAAFWADRFLW